MVVRSELAQLFAPSPFPDGQRPHGPHQLVVLPLGEKFRRRILSEPLRSDERSAEIDKQQKVIRTVI